MYHCSMKEMVTLQYDSFAALSEQAKEVALMAGHLKRVAEQAHRGQLLLDELRREHPGWKTIWHQEWGLFLLEHLFYDVTAMQGREGQWHMQRHPNLQQTAMIKEMAPEHPSGRTLLESTDQEILDVFEQVYRGQYEVVPSILPHRCQDQFITKLHEELGQCLVRAGLSIVMGTAHSLYRGRRHLQAHSLS